MLRSIVRPVSLVGLLAMAPNVVGQPIDVFVALSSTSYPLEDTSGLIPIDVTIGLENVSDQDLIAAAGLRERPFDKDLVFIAPDGREIRANSLKNSQATQGASGEPVDVAPPRVCRDGQVQVQCDQVEVLNGQLNPPPFGLEFPNEDLGQLLDARDDFSFDQTGYWKVKAVVAIRLYNSIFTTRNGIPFARVDDGFAVDGNSNIAVFALTGDGDGDGFSWSPESPDDCDDTDPAVNPGAAEVLGNGIDDDCNPATPDELLVSPGPDGVIAVRTRQLTLTPGITHWSPQVTKGPIVAMPVRFFDRASQCVSTFSPTWQHFKSIWLSCVTPFRGLTGDDGLLSISLPPGSYQVIGKVPGGEDVYLGKVRLVESELTTPVRLFFIKKENGKTVPGKSHRFTGSDLLIIEPEYVEWDGVSETYPFVFESEGDWTVTTSVAPPEGFVADQDAITSDVNSELEAVQFSVTDIGSDWVSTGVEYDILHKAKGKTTKRKVSSKIGVRLSKKLAKEKRLSVWGKEQPERVRKPTKKALNTKLTTRQLKAKIRKATKGQVSRKIQQRPTTESITE